jgi:glucokinase
MSAIAGVDIGGTKTAVVLATRAGEEVRLIAKQRFTTPAGPGATLDAAVRALELLLAESGEQVEAVGVCCGGPLDSRRGLVLSPPNLPGWDAIDAVGPFARRFRVPVRLQNDANAGALAEWRWGAGRGCRSMIFLTFGTGLGAGLILDGRLYSGANDLAGEAGHLRIAESGPVGYGKAGSFEGFCSGGGIARQAVQAAELALAAGKPPAFCPDRQRLETITAQNVAEAAQAGDPLALAIFAACGQRLGQGLALLIDLLNPERIVIGGIYARQHALLEPAMRAALETEALTPALAACQVLPAALGEEIGDYAAVAVGIEEKNI